MKRIIRDLGLLLVLLLVGQMPVAYAQDSVTLLENIEIIAIESIQGHEEEHTTYLNVRAAIANTNDQAIRLRNRQLEFFLGTLTRETDGQFVKDESKRLGIDHEADEILLRIEPTPLGRDSDGVNDVLFRVDLGFNDADVCTILAHILNCLGNPGAQAPFLTIIGTADVGLQDSKGSWDFLTGRIEWELLPQVQPRFLLYYGNSQE